MFVFGYNLSKYCKLPWVDCLGDWDTLVILGGGQYRVDYFTLLILSWPHICQPSSVCAFSLYFWFKYDLGQKYYALQVQSDQGLNSWPPDHESTLHVAEMPALTAQPSVTFNAIQEDTSNVYKHCRQANYSIWIDLSWQNSIIHLCILPMYLTIPHMVSTGNLNPDFLILSPTPYPLGHMLPLVHRKQKKIHPKKLKRST